MCVLIRIVCALVIVYCDAVSMDVSSVKFIGNSGLTWRCSRIIFGLIAALWVYSAASGPCLVDDFDAQVKRILKEEMLTRAEIANLSSVFHDFQKTLQIRWPGSKVIPLGSFVTGLASKSSDADCMVTIPPHYTSTERQLIIEAANLLTQHPELYQEVDPRVDPNRRIALLKFTYTPTRRNCDVNFISNLALYNTKMMAYYFSLDDKFLSLAAILKLWAKIQGLRTGTIQTNTLNLLVIFYLQQENLAPPFFLLQKHLTRCPINDWETSFEQIRYNYTEMPSLYQLLGRFFQYYSDFNFDDYVVSPLLGRPIHKRLFKDIEGLPEELSLYKDYMRKPNSRPLSLNTKLCVQDVIEQRRNTALVSEDKANTFITLVKLAATMYEVHPKDRFLSVILNITNTQYDNCVR